MYEKHSTPPLKRKKKTEGTLHNAVNVIGWSTEKVWMRKE